MTEKTDSPQALPAGAQGVVNLRRPGTSTIVKQRRYPKAEFLIMVVCPVVLGVLYWGIIASPRYTASAEFTIRADSTVPGAMELSRLGLVPVGVDYDNKALLAFIPSRACMTKTDLETDILQHWADRRWDHISRLGAHEPVEEQVWYWQRRVHVEWREDTGQIRLRVQAFTPEKALAACAAILRACEELTNDLSREMLAKRKAFLDQELEHAHALLTHSRAKVAAFQKRYDAIDPVGQVTTIADTIAKIESSLALERAALVELLATKGDDSPEVLRQKARIAALDQEIQRERNRVTGASGTSDIADIVSQWQQLQIELEHATKTYATVLASQQQARAELARQIKHLQVVVPPALPEEASHPPLLYNTLLLAIICLALWFVWATVRAIVREHRD
ncbi:MAG: hypothetical protein N3B15_05410 [Planctomycetota bacterium]|nr:hypothetical protein [Planctomycetota bacterium]